MVNANRLLPAPFEWLLLFPNTSSIRIPIHREIGPSSLRLTASWPDSIFFLSIYLLIRLYPSKYFFLFSSTEGEPFLVAPSIPISPWINLSFVFFAFPTSNNILTVIYIFSYLLLQKRVENGPGGKLMMIGVVALSLDRPSVHLSFYVLYIFIFSLLLFLLLFIL